MGFALILLPAVIGYSLKPHYANSIACIFMLFVDFLLMYAHAYTCGHVGGGDEPNTLLITYVCFHTQSTRKLVTEGSHDQCKQ